MANKGLEIVGDSFDKWIEETKKRLHECTAEAVAEQLEEIASVARELAPVKTGNMRNAIYIKHEDGSQYGSVRVDATKAWYARLVHFGDKFRAGRPWMYQASEQCAGNFKPRIESKIAEGNK
jgi:HK97 gp10 family phage protein